MLASDMSVASFWDARAKEMGHTPSAVGNSEWSHSRRMALVRRLLGVPSRLSVVDIGSGVGMLDKYVGPFRSYLGVDWSIEALAISSQNAVTQDHHTLQWDLSRGLPDIGSFDVALAIGVTPCGWLFSSPDAVVAFMRGMLRLAPRGVINVMWDRVESPDEPARFSIDDILMAAKARGVHGVLHFGDLPHEFMIDFVAPTRAWDK